MSSALTRLDLDGIGCQTPGCDCDGTVFLAARCHPAQGTEVTYHDGVVTIHCFVCKRAYASIAVKDWHANAMKASGDLN